MIAPELAKLRSRVRAEGLREGETVFGLVEDCKRLIVEAVTARHEKKCDAARELGVSRECYHGMRKRYGLDIDKPRVKSQIPHDWRERLNAAKSANDSAGHLHEGSGRE